MLPFCCVWIGWERDWLPKVCCLSSKPGDVRPTLVPKGCLQTKIGIESERCVVLIFDFWFLIEYPCPFCIVLLCLNRRGMCHCAVTWLRIWKEWNKLSVCRVSLRMLKWKCALPFEWRFCVTAVRVSMLTYPFASDCWLWSDGHSVFAHCVTVCVVYSFRTQHCRGR